MSAVEQHRQRKHEPMPPGGSVDSSSNGFPTSQSPSSSGNATTWDLYSMETPKQANRKKQSAHSEIQSQSEKSSLASGKSLPPIREKENRPQLEQQQQQQLLVKRSSEGLFPSLTHLLSFRRHDSYSRRSLEGEQPTPQANELDPPRVPNHITPPPSVCSSDKKSSKQQIQKQRPHSWSSSSTAGNNDKRKSHPTAVQRVPAQVEDQQKLPSTMARDGGTPRSSPKTLQRDVSYRKRSMESAGSSTSSSHGMRVLEEMDRTIAARNSAYKRESASSVLSSSLMAGTILESKAAKSPPGKPSLSIHDNNNKDSPVAASPPVKEQHQEQRQARQPIVLKLAPARVSSLTNQSNDGFSSPRSSANSAEKEKFYDEGSPQPKRLVRDDYQKKQQAVGTASSAAAGTTEPKAKMQPQPPTPFARMPDVVTERTTATTAAALTANDTSQYGRRPDVQGLFAERLARKTAEERDRRNSTHAKRQKSNDYDNGEQVSLQVFDRDLMTGEGERARLTGSESNGSHHSDRHHLQEPHDIDDDDDGVSNAAESVEQTRPGAYAQRGRAYGEFPAWGRGRRAPPTRHHDDASSATSHSTNPVRWVWASLSRPSRVIRRLASMGQHRQELASHQLPRAVNITSVIEEGRSSHYETSEGRTNSRHGEENMRRSVEATATSLILPDKIVTESEHRRFRRCIVAGVAVSLFFFLLTIGLLVAFLVLDTGILGTNQNGGVESPPTSRLEEGSVVVFPTNAETLPPTICDEVQAAGSTNATIQPIVQCLCGYTSLVGGLTIDQINSYNNISRLLETTTTNGLASPVKTVCTPESAAIWWLAEHQHRSLEAIRVRYALVMLFVSLRGLYWANNSNWLTTRSVCEWEGVKCHDALLDGRGGFEGGERVAEIALPRQELHGQLPEPGINLLSNLEMLVLNHNRLEGALPASLPLSLKSLNLSGNQFRGVLPSWWSNLSVVQNLDVSSNPGLSGVIPTEWGEAVEAQSGLTRLRLLDLRDSIDGGSVPSALCSASSSNITIRIDCDVVVECPCCECA